MWSGAAGDFEKALRLAPPEWPLRRTVEQWIKQARAQSNRR
jgi:hypothetical protein